MKFGSALYIAVIALGLIAPPRSFAAGPDDMYLDAYRQIQEADEMVSSGQPELARQRYEDARKNLKQLQVSYPSYSKNAVEYRIDYVQEKLKSLPAAKESAQPPVRSPQTSQKPEDQLKALNERIAQLESDNGLLQAKLKEALAPQPAALDPRELAKAEERIKELEKQKELLRVSLEQAQAKQPQAGDAVMLDQARAELENTRKQLVENVGRVAALTQENQQLQQSLVSAKANGETEKALADAKTRIATLEQERTQLQAKANEAGSSDSAKVKNLEKERDSLMKRLNDANKELYDTKARGQAAQFETLTNQLANLRARLEVFDARKIPFTKEELALMDKNVPKLASNLDAKPAKRAPRELPAGAGTLIAAAEAAFAAHRYPEAEQKYEQVLKLDENNPVSLANLAAIQLEMQKLDAAEANLKKALAERPDDAYSLSLMGMLWFQQGNYEQALDSLSRSAQLDPKNPETENYLGITLSQQGQREAAETALRKAIMLNPNYAGAHHNLAVIYATQKPPFLELARFHYNKALALGQPANPDLEKQLDSK